jgi:hypothetical protein
MTALDPRTQPINLTDHHANFNEAVRLRQRLAGSEQARSLLLHDLDDAHRELRRLRLENARLRVQAYRGGIGWVEWAYYALIGLWASLTGDRRHETWTLPIAAGVSMAVFLMIALAVGR